MNTGRRAVRFVMFAACISGWPLPVAQSASNRALTVGVVVNQAEFENGGCELLLSSNPSDPYSSEQYVFMSDLNHRAVMNINGHDTLFTLVRSTGAQKQIKNGDQTKYWYSSGSIAVEVDYTVTGVCPPRDESCEVTYYSAMIRISAGATTRLIAAHGLCGV